MITQEQLRAFTPRAKIELTQAINEVCDRFDIETLRRVRYFVTQAAFETQGFSAFVENLTYSTPERLVAVWPSRFSLQPDSKKALASEYINKPEKLANLVYANRNGNGDRESGDGYTFRGAGAFHLTGRANYKAASQYLYGDDRLVKEPDLVRLDINVGMMTAGWFWDIHGLNALADADEFSKVTAVINGSKATVPARLALLNTANTIFV